MNSRYISDIDLRQSLDEPDSAKASAIAIVHRVRTYANPPNYWIISDRMLLEALEEALDGEALTRLRMAIETRLKR